MSMRIAGKYYFIFLGAYKIGFSEDRNFSDP
jgi:hypothetical protein